MSDRLTNRSLQILESLAEYRLLSISQIAALYSLSERMTRRERGKLERHHFVEMIPRYCSQSRGRPEQLITLSQKGIKKLFDEGFLRKGQELEPVSVQGHHAIEHQLLLNWVCIYVRHLNQAMDDLNTDFLLSNSPFLPSPSFLSARRSLDDSKRNPQSFIPDGVFFIKSIKKAKDLLFFVEVDRSNEKLSILKKKILNYQVYFRKEDYKKYQGHWKKRFNGFRLLIITNKETQLNTLSSLTLQNPPSDFVWLTDEDSLNERGISGEIWIRGGRKDTPRQSILNSEMAFDTHILPIKS